MDLGAAPLTTFERKVQAHIAWASVAPTTLRGMLEKGGRRKICAALAQLPLATIADRDYSILLNEWTETVRSRSGAAWGPTRKALNLFLRDVSYNFWLRARVGIDTHEREMEIPLDGLVMQALRNTSGTALSRSSVKALTSKISQEYQAVAAEAARAKGIARVHLDLDLWAGRDRVD